MSKSRADYSKLYLRILQIGQKRLKEGLSYNTLIKQLEQEGYDLENDCVELAVKHWFFESFFHLNLCAKPEDVDNHKDCNFVLKAEHSLKLIEHSSSRKNLTIAIIALVVAIASVAVSIWLSV